MALRCFTIMVFLAACSCTPGVPVTGGGERDPTYNGSQSETVSATAIHRIQRGHLRPIGGTRKMLIVAYNDDTYDGKIVYANPAERRVFPGASLLGWSYSSNNGASWKYGGKVKPPAGYAALWGDPAIVTSKTNASRVYISSLAIPSLPSGGQTGPLNNFAKGACVARSGNGGYNFAIHSCFAKNVFYDGATMAAAAGPTDQRIFAAYMNVPNSRIDVWQSPDGIAPFQQIGNPFPGMTMQSHPRLAYDDASGALLVAAAQAGSQKIFLNRLVGNQWQTPIMASWPASMTIVQIGSVTIRTANAFAFDVGSPSFTAVEGTTRITRVYKDAIRLLYTTRDSQTSRLYVRGTGCARDLSVCTDAPQWGTTPGNFNTPGHQWNPTVKAWRGSSGSPPIWKATYQSTDDRNDRVSIKQGTLGRSPLGTPSFQPYPLMTPRIICPDNRSYWGDYDESAFIGLTNNVPKFMLAFSDSSQGCFKRWMFTSTHLHVRAVQYK